MYGKRSSVVTTLLCILLLLLAVSSAEAAVFRVNGASTASAPDGRSWATAYTTIQAAVDAAASGDEIWVAQGTYTATTTGEDPSVVVLKAGISLYGGFTGAETARQERGGIANRTTIDGENARRCLYAADRTAYVDSFTLQNGAAKNGAGMCNATAAFCTFDKNVASGSGGGLSDGEATNCIFSRNMAGAGGGMSGGKANYCTFTENEAFWEEGLCTAMWIPVPLNIIPLWILVEDCIVEKR